MSQKWGIAGCLFVVLFILVLHLDASAGNEREMIEFAGKLRDFVDRMPREIERGDGRIRRNGAQAGTDLPPLGEPNRAFPGKSNPSDQAAKKDELPKQDPPRVDVPPARTPDPTPLHRDVIGSNGTIVKPSVRNIVAQNNAPNDSRTPIDDIKAKLKRIQAKYLQPIDMAIVNAHAAARQHETDSMNRETNRANDLFNQLTKDQDFIDLKNALSQLQQDPNLSRINNNLKIAVDGLRARVGDLNEAQKQYARAVLDKNFSGIGDCEKNSATDGRTYSEVQSQGATSTFKEPTNKELELLRQFDGSMSTMSSHDFVGRLSSIGSDVGIVRAFKEQAIALQNWEKEIAPNGSSLWDASVEFLKLAVQSTLDGAQEVGAKVLQMSKSYLAYARTAPGAIDVATTWTPLSTLRDGYEAISGKDLLTEEPISTGRRALAVSGLVIALVATPVVAGPIKAIGIASVEKIVASLGKTVGKAAIKGAEASMEAGVSLAKAEEKAKGAANVAKTMGQNIPEVVEEIISKNPKTLGELASAAQKVGPINGEKAAQVLSGATSEANAVFAKLITEAKPTKGTVHLMETTLEDGSKVIFRRDVGVKAHFLKEKRYRDMNVIDHYNVEVHVPSKTGGFDIVKNRHLILDKNFNVIDSF